MHFRHSLLNRFFLTCKWKWYLTTFGGILPH
jgi:hypothetical protein